MTQVPARSRHQRAVSNVSGLPTTSNETLTPLPPVRALIAATASPSFGLTVWVAPNSLAQASFWGSTSTAMIVVAPASFAPMMTESPTPPQPMTATDWPGLTFAELKGALTPVPTPQPIKLSGSGLRLGLTGTHCSAWTRVWVQKVPMPRMGVSLMPSWLYILPSALRLAAQRWG